MGKNSNVSEIALSLAKKNNTVINGIPISVALFGAKGDGITNDTVPIQNALNSGKSIQFESNKNYLVDSLSITNDHIDVFGNDSILLKNPLTTSDFINITGNYVNITDLNIKSNGAQPTVDGLILRGDYINIRNVNVVGFNYSIDVYGDYNIIDTVEVKDSNYASNRLFAGTKKLNQYILNNFRSVDSKVKGFVYNGTLGIRDIFVTNFVATTALPTADDASNGFLIDSGEVESVIRVDRLIVDKAYIKVGGSGAFKIQNTKYAFLNDIDFDTIATYSSSYGIRTTALSTYISNIACDDRITFFGSGYIENLTAKNNVTKVKSHFIEIGGNLGDTVEINNCDFSQANITSDLIRIDRVAGFEHYLKVSNIKGVLANRLIGVYSTPPNTTTFIQLGGKVYNSNGITSASSFNRNIVYDTISTKNIYYFSAVPTVGTFNIGDMIYNSTPTAGGYLGWVCTVAGTPGTWKGFGLIQA